MKYFWKIAIFIILFLSVYFTPQPIRAQQLGASLYVVPPSENPTSGNNFTLSIKTDSLEQPINAVKGILAYNKDRVEIVSVSKIGSILNLWVEEPQFSNREGILKFQGGVPKPGFIGNGGTVLLVIFRAKLAGLAHLSWKEGEVLAADGKGTNILSNLQNVTFEISENTAAGSATSNQLLTLFMTVIAVGGGIS